ncbi:MAG TPA: adenylate/guanylate cyclase domain-containing protein, partial [Pirellulales bacterium]
MSSRSGEFAAYVPGTVLRRLQRNPVCAASGEGWRGLAVALFADVAGSTKMANRLAKLGRLVGPEEMCRILNAYYSPLISKLHDRGGDVVGFAGDAVMAVWHAEDESAIKAAVRQAAQAAIEIQRDLNNMELAAGVRLSLRICLGAGELSMALVGGRQGFHQLIAYGPPLDQIRAAGDALRIGEVYLSREAKNYLGGGAALDAQPDGSAFVRRLTSPPSPERAAPLDAASLPEESLRLFVPRAVQESVDAGVSEFLDQARTVSTLFVRIARPTGMLPQWE